MRSVIVAVICLGALIAACDFSGPPEKTSRDAGSESSGSRVVSESPPLPPGFWFDAGFPPRGTAGFTHREDVAQPWSLPCPEVRRLPVDVGRTAAYGLTSGHGGWYPYVKDRRQLVLYREPRQAHRAVVALVHQLSQCPSSRVVVKDSQPLPGIGHQGRYLRIHTRLHPAITYPGGGRIKKIGDRVYIARSGRAVLVTDVGYDFDEVVPSLPAKHLIVVKQLCGFAPHPCRLPSHVGGAGPLKIGWLPQPSQLAQNQGLTRKRISSGSRAAEPMLCSRASWAALGAAAVLRGDYSDGSAKPSATVALAEFSNQEKARRAVMHLNAWLGTCAVGLDLAGRFDYSSEETCWIINIKVREGDAHGCATDYVTREAPDFTAADLNETDDSDGIPGEQILQTGVLRVGRRVAVVEKSIPYSDAAEGSIGTVPRSLRELARHIATEKVSEPTYDGRDHMSAPVRLGAPVATLRDRRNPLIVPLTFDGCTQVRLRNGSTVIVDHSSRRVVAIEVGDATMTARGVSATSTGADLRSAYPEGVRTEDEDDYGQIYRTVRASLPDGSQLQYTDASDRGGDSRTVYVSLPNEHCRP